MYRQLLRPLPMPAVAPLSRPPRLARSSLRCPIRTNATHLLPLPQSIMRLVYLLPFRDVVLAVEAWEWDAVKAMLVSPNGRLSSLSARNSHTLPDG